VRIEKEILFQSFNYHFLQIYSKRNFACAILITMIIIIYLGNQKNEMNFSIRQIIHSYTNFNNFPYQIRSSISRKRFEVVLNYYGEDVANVVRFIRYLRNSSTLKKLQAHIILYNKYSIINNTLLKTLLKVDIVQGLPNIGREGATYLYHIIENYDKLANHILFSQAGVEGMTDTGLKDWFLHRLEKQFNSSVGYMPLVGKKGIDTFDCGVRKGENDDENMQRLPELWGIIEQTLCPPGGQAVSEK